METSSGWSCIRGSGTRESWQSQVLVQEQQLGPPHDVAPWKSKPFLGTAVVSHGCGRLGTELSWERRGGRTVVCSAALWEFILRLVFLTGLSTSEQLVSRWSS
ncbi:hypothetical protein TorRG33x02_175620 [Trema orientale]|uniref:Uncharacterized protein n=1 Tax=Trema orientale TaxID=63057 RepID=A0A2P5EM61_TREOI|nr:hypothetical protein TorRG33x02_175620 [Trema orientale]